MRNVWKTQFIVAKTDWQNRLIKWATKESLDEEIRKQLLSMIACYCLTFKDKPELQNYVTAGVKLHKKGIKLEYFPPFVPL